MRAISKAGMNSLGDLNSLRPGLSYVSQSRRGGSLTHQLAAAKQYYGL